jgi:hypothetical protein
MTRSSQALKIADDEDDGLSKRYIEINTLLGGKSFGDLALIG